MATPSPVVRPLAAGAPRVISLPLPLAAIARICSVVADRTVTGVDRPAGVATASGSVVAARAGLEIPTSVPVRMSAVNGAAARSQLLCTTVVTPLASTVPDALDP